MYKYDASAKREEVLERFHSDARMTVLLVSLKAGGYGLNLTCACHCVIMEPFWNPYAENQAIDRIHRIGQTKAVTVHRIEVTDTVEDRIRAMQEKVRFR